MIIKNLLSVLALCICMTAAPVEANVIVEYSNRNLPVGAYLVEETIPIDQIESTISDVQFNFGEPVTVYLTQAKVNNGRTLGRTYPDNTIQLFIPDRPFPGLYDRTIVHELGHIVELNMTRAQEREYRKIRGIPDDWVDMPEVPYENRPGEIFAEDFRILFGGETAAMRRHMNRRLKHPTEVEGLKDFMENL